MSKPSVQDTATFRHNDRYVIAALLSLCAAMLCFGVGVFITYPGSGWGIVFASFGLALELTAIACFMRYAYYSRKSDKGS
jgi:hypothetical protein